MLDSAGVASEWLTKPVELINALDPVEYTGLFDVGNPEPLVPLMETHYHQDKQARLRRIVTFYRTYGVVHEAEYAPDHICVELSYLGYLARLAVNHPDRPDLVRACEEFAAAHPLAWVARVTEELKRLEAGTPFIELFDGVSQFLSAVAGRQVIPSIAV